jgi:hypothetical protein
MTPVEFDRKTTHTKFLIFRGSRAAAVILRIPHFYGVAKHRKTGRRRDPARP